MSRTKSGPHIPRGAFPVGKGSKEFPALRKSEQGIYSSSSSSSWRHQQRKREGGGNPNFLRSSSDMAKERETFVYIAKLAEQAERYDEMVDSMKNVAKLDVELTVEEGNLLSVGYKNVIGARRASWRILSSIEQKEEGRGNDHDVKKIKEYRQEVETELTEICNDIMTVIDEHLIPSSAAGESTVFNYKMKGDYYRYLAEFKAGNDRKEVADLSLKAYETASIAAEADLAPTHPTRLGLALNFAVFYHEIMNSPERACQLTKQAINEAISELDTLSESYKDSTFIVQLLRDNLTLWTGEDSQKMDGSAKAGAGEDAEQVHLTTYTKTFGGIDGAGIRLANEVNLRFVHLKSRILYANVSYDHMVGWRTSSIGGKQNLLKPPQRSLDGYKPVVDVEYCLPVSFDGPHFPPAAAKAKEAVQNTSSDKKQ